MAVRDLLIDALAHDALAAVVVVDSASMARRMASVTVLPSSWELGVQSGA